ncbi:MAG: hypothetical protein ABI569_06655 [Casimicrobiaceae bacterium]
MKRCVGMDESGPAYDDVADFNPHHVNDEYAKPRHGGSVVVLAGVCRNPEGVIVAEADGKMLVHGEA